MGIELMDVAGQSRALGLTSLEIVDIPLAGTQGHVRSLANFPNVISQFFSSAILRT